MLLQRGCTIRAQRGRGNPWISWISSHNLCTMTLDFDGEQNFSFGLFKKVFPKANRWSLKWVRCEWWLIWISLEKCLTDRIAYVTLIWKGFLLLTLLSRNHKFSEHSWSLPRDCRAWCPCGWSWSCGGTWRPWGSGRGTPWCGPRWGAAATRWSCEGRSALARLWGRFLGKSRCGEAEKEDTN